MVPGLRARESRSPPDPRAPARDRGGPSFFFARLERAPSAMPARTFPCNPFEENVYIAFDEVSKEAIVIDPGFYNEEEFLKADSFLKQNGLVVRRVLNTHLHLDHCIGNGWALRKWNIGAEASEKDLFLIRNAAIQAQMFGLELNEALPDPCKFLKSGDSISVGSLQFLVLEVPGHSPGGLAFYSPKERVVFAGDTLFRGSYGRTDLPGGNTDQLFNSIRTKLLTLPDDTVVLCGHGPATTIGEEKLNF